VLLLLHSFLSQTEGGSEKSRLLDGGSSSNASMHAVPSSSLRGRAACVYLRTLSSDPARQLNVLGHDGDALGVDGAQVRVLEQTDEVGLASLLQRHHGRALEAQIGLEVLRYLSDETLEGQLAYEQLRALLIATDLSQRHSAGPVTMRLLDASRRWGALASSLRRQLLPGSLSSRRFASGLLRTCHDNYYYTSLSNNKLRLSHSTVTG
jgi:hypothetical protein